MKGRVVVRPQADRDTEELALYIARGNLEAARRFYEAVDATFQQLAGMPELGVVRYFGAPGLTHLRMFPVRDFPTYLVFYRPTEDGIEIVRILRGARDISAILDDEG